MHGREGCWPILNLVLYWTVVHFIHLNFVSAGQLTGELRLVGIALVEQEAPLADWRSITMVDGGQCVTTDSV